MRNDSIDRTTIEMRLIPMKFHFIVINQMEKLFQLKNLNNTKQVWGFTLRQMFFLILKLVNAYKLLQNEIGFFSFA